MQQRWWRVDLWEGEFGMWSVQLVPTSTLIKNMDIQSPLEDLYKLNMIAIDMLRGSASTVKSGRSERLIDLRWAQIRGWAQLVSG